MSVGRLCTRVVHTATTDEPVEAAAARLREAHVGCLVVVDEARRPIGLLTDRDLTVRVLARGLGPTTRVADAMTAGPVLARVDMPIEDAVRLMRGHGVRRLPVVDADGRLEGLVTVDDVMGLLAEEMAQVGGLLDRQAPQRQVPKLGAPAPPKGGAGRRPRR